jgi:hypothetical protein
MLMNVVKDTLEIMGHGNSEKIESEIFGIITRRPKRKKDVSLDDNIYHQQQRQHQPKERHKALEFKPIYWQFWQQKPMQISYQTPSPHKTSSKMTPAYKPKEPQPKLDECI